MLNESLLSLSLSELKNFLIHDLALFDIALTYILVYVVYVSLGRYIYFKPQEHSSKVNRTFLVVSLLAVCIHFMQVATEHLPFLEEYRWLYTALVVVLLVSPLSILSDRLLYKYKSPNNKTYRYRGHLPIQHDYYKTVVAKSSRDGGSYEFWEEEVVESTNKNVHSDTLLNICSLVIFIIVGMKWAVCSMTDYGVFSVAFSIIIILYISLIFIERGVFSWIKYVENKCKH